MSYRLFDNAGVAFLVLWYQQAACLRRPILQESAPEKYKSFTRVRSH